jgi:hypothetical protein
VLNALESIRQAEAMLAALPANEARLAQTVRLAAEETQDAIDMLSSAALHEDAVTDLIAAKLALAGTTEYGRNTERALAALRRARGDILAGPPPANTSVE